VPPECAAVFERQAGYLLVENCVLAHVQEATKLGAELLTGEAVTGWHVDGSGVNVRTDSARFTARRLVITAGAWADQLLRDLAIPLRVLQKHLHWFVNNDPRYHRDRGSPAFLYELPGGIFYGFPQHDKLGVKVGEHSGGAAVTDPLTAGRSVDRADRERVEEFLRAHLPGVSRDVTRHSVCYYTMSPDEHFIVDRHPQYEAVVFAAGLSGHGFKFTSVLGEVLTDLSLDGKTNLPIGFLNCRRPTLRQ
jgi:glycine/D-amino acid oxidase-like deaminating enzyme